MKNIASTLASVVPTADLYSIRQLRSRFASPSQFTFRNRTAQKHHGNGNPSFLHKYETKRSRGWVFSSLAFSGRETQTQLEGVQEKASALVRPFGSSYRRPNFARWHCKIAGEIPKVSSILVRQPYELFAGDTFLFKPNPMSSLFLLVKSTYVWWFKVPFFHCSSQPWKAMGWVTAWALQILRPRIQPAKIVI
jgi:hypothetical protein